MATAAPIDEVMEGLNHIPMSKEKLDQIKAKFLQSRADAETNDPLLNLAKITKKCIDDLKDRLVYIQQRRDQRAAEEEQKTLAFAAALAERNKAKELEKTTKKGQKQHRTRIEGWRDEVKQLCGTIQQEQQNSSRQKRPLDNSSFEQYTNTSTPLNKRMKTTAQNDSSSLIAPPTSSRKSIPWLSTRASMADEDIFADDDRPPPARQINLNKKKLIHDKDDQDADEKFDREEDDADSKDSYASTSLTELEQLAAVEMAVVGMMTVVRTCADMDVDDYF
ncbi:hypothetical protein E4T49_05974 [Aureobasidium sp. EXF-10728]|nr:hypothetical protein E4T49_05974 [Aureobasidium sp. EXF-10728]